jgi:hypothetical protein
MGITARCSQQQFFLLSTLSGHDKIVRVTSANRDYFTRVQMRKFRVSLEGKNFIINSETGPERFGFFTTRYVEARDDQEATEVALNLIRNDKSLMASVLNKKNDAPMLYVEEIVELGDFEGLKPPGGGYSLYPMNGED